MSEWEEDIDVPAVEWPSDGPSGSDVCASSAGGSVPADPDGLNNPIRHWPNDPTIPGCNEHCHRAAHPATEGLDVDEQAAILDDAIGPVDFGEVARSEVMYSVVRALHEKGYAVGLSSPEGQP